MSTIRFGSSLGPSGVSAERGFGRENGSAEEPVDAGDGDPNRLVQCPYDKNHQIRVSRFPFHVLKCRKNHPRLASELKTCPFNARHLIHRDELSHHVAHCESKPSVSDSDHMEILEKFQVPVNTWTNPSPSEDWESEVDDDAALFVWGESNNPLTPNKPEPSSAAGLPDGVRAPRTLPWRLCACPEERLRGLVTRPSPDSF